MNKFIDLEAYEATSIALKEYIDKNIKKAADEIVIQKDSYLNFPLVGSSHAVYIDTTRHSIYRWDDENLKYYIVVDSYENIDVIDGCGK